MSQEQTSEATATAVASREKLNVYWVDGGYVPGYYTGHYEPPEPYYARGIFVAATPAQAKRDMLREFNNDVEWNDLKVRVLAKGLELPRGVFDEECPEGPWDDPDAGIEPPEPWATVWAALDKVLDTTTTAQRSSPKERS